MSDTTDPAGSTPSANAAPASIPPGWYDEGTGSGLMRWWSGAGWTEHVAVPVAGPASGPAVAPTAGPVAMAAPVRPALPADRPVYSVWIWLVVLLPLLSYISLLFYRPDFSYLSSSDYLDDPLAFQSHYLASLFTPAYVVILLTGWLVYGLMVVFAWRDVVWLRTQGVVRPFHWAWTFLNSWVYIIGRSVIVYGVARPRGRAPIWVLVAVAVVGFAVSIIWTVSMMGDMMSHLPDFSSYSDS